MHASHIQFKKVINYSVWISVNYKNLPENQLNTDSIWDIILMLNNVFVNWEKSIIVVKSVQYKYMINVRVKMFSGRFFFTVIYHNGNEIQFKVRYIIIIMINDILVFITNIRKVQWIASPQYM